jgi:2-oxoisovalerate dehydrogenase E2 component (dihydrolipoyl transacylase)
MNHNLVRESFSLHVVLFIELRRSTISVCREKREKGTRVFHRAIPVSLHHLTRTLLLHRNVSPLSPIGAFEPLCEVQSDKASVEITSPFDGTVKEILVQEGQIAKVGEDLCIIEAEEEASNPSDVPASELRDTSVNESLPPFQEQKRDPQPPSDKNPVVRRLHPLDPNASLPPASESKVLTLQPGPSSELVTAATTADVLALPAVRHFARENGVNIALLAPGSGKNGRVERVDVERYLAGGKSGSVGEQLAAVSPSPPAEGDIVVELARTRYGMWKAMEKARTGICISALRAMSH